MLRAPRTASTAPALALGLALASLPGAAPAPAAAAEVYQWKDARGVTHYSQTPPQQGRYQARAFYHREPVGPGAPAADSAAGESPQCATARRNIDLLQSGAKLQMDSDNDGKPDRDLGDGEREKQLQIAQTVARVNCSVAAKAP